MSLNRKEVQYDELREDYEKFVHDYQHLKQCRQSEANEYSKQISQLTEKVKSASNWINSVYGLNLIRSLAFQSTSAARNYLRWKSRPTEKRGSYLKLTWAS